MGYNLNILHLLIGYNYNTFTNHLLTFWDILVDDAGSDGFFSMSVFGVMVVVVFVEPGCFLEGWMQLELFKKLFINIS